MENPLNSLPTDNLYKFMALGGIVFYMFLIWHVDERVDASRLAIGETDANTDVLEEQLNILKEDLPRMTNYVGKLMNELPSDEDRINTAESNMLHIGVPTGFVLDDFHFLVDSLDKKKADVFNEVSNYSKSFNEIRLKNVELRNQEHLAQIAIVKEEEARSELRSYGPISIILCFLGFFQWYYRVQIFQDRIIKAEAEKHSSSHKQAKRISPETSGEDKAA